MNVLYRTYKNYVVKCIKCGSVLSYNTTDLKFKHLDKSYNSLYTYIQCPVCNDIIQHSEMYLHK